MFPGGSSLLSFSSLCNDVHPGPLVHEDLCGLEGDEQVQQALLEVVVQKQGALVVGGVSQALAGTGVHFGVVWLAPFGPPQFAKDC